MYGITLPPGATISPVVLDVTFVTLSTRFTSAEHTSFYVLFVFERKSQIKLLVSIVDLGGGFHHQ